MGVILVVLPDIGQHDVQPLAQVPLESILSQDPMVQVVGIPQVFGVLEDAAPVVKDLSLVDHVRNLRDVVLVQLPERREGVESLGLVGGDLGVEHLDRLVRLPEVDLAVIAQISADK